MSETSNQFPTWNPLNVFSIDQDALPNNVPDGERVVGRDFEFGESKIEFVLQPEGGTSVLMSRPAVDHELELPEGPQTPSVMQWREGDRIYVQMVLSPEAVMCFVGWFQVLNVEQDRLKPISAGFLLAGKASEEDPVTEPAGDTSEAAHTAREEKLDVA